MLALDTAPATWPVGRGRDFIGTIDIASGGVRLLEGDAGKTGDLRQMSGRRDRRAQSRISMPLRWPKNSRWCNDACKPFRSAGVPRGPSDAGVLRQRARRISASAICLTRSAPSRRRRARRMPTSAGSRPMKADMTAFVFKVQANMDPNHRDRIAFARMCSGKLERGMKVKQVRTGKTMSLQAPQFFFARDRALAEEAFAGDVVGIPNHGTLRIGDTLTEGEELNFVGVPSFAPEILRRVRLPDAMKAKKLQAGVAGTGGRGRRAGVPAARRLAGAGRRRRALQLDVLKVRLADEYGLEMAWDQSEFQLARWITADDRKLLDQLMSAHRSAHRRGSRWRHCFSRPQRLQSGLYK